MPPSAAMCPAAKLFKLSARLLIAPVEAIRPAHRRSEIVAKA
jgi:hypothetical protein